MVAVMDFPRQPLHTEIKARHRWSMLGSLILHGLVVAVAFVLVHHRISLLPDEAISISVIFEAPAAIQVPAPQVLAEDLLPEKIMPDPVPQTSLVPTPLPLAENSLVSPLPVEAELSKPSIVPALPTVPTHSPLPVPPRPVPRRQVPIAPSQAISKPSATPAPSAALATPAIPSVVVAARPVSGVDGHCQPDYPLSALRRGQQGLVVVRVTISPQGQVVTANLAQSSGTPALDNAALAKVVHDCRFVPASRDGLPVEGVALQPMKFEIQG